MWGFLNGGIPPKKPVGLEENDEALDGMGYPSFRHTQTCQSDTNLQ